jgi:hypothetical protein
VLRRGGGAPCLIWRPGHEVGEVRHALGSTGLAAAAHTPARKDPVSDRRTVRFLEYYIVDETAEGGDILHLVWQPL